MGRKIQIAAKLIISAASLLSVSLVAAGTAFAQSSSPIQGQQPIQTQSQPSLPVSGPQATPQTTADITGTVEDETGAAIAGAKVTLASGGHALNRVAVSDTNGQFTFAAVSSGNFQLAISATGFATKTQSVSVNPGEPQTIPPITLAIATEITQVRVGLSHDEIVEMAHEEIKEEEKQRVLGVFPNFYVTYIPDAAPLTPKQKFQLAFRSTIDPVTFLVTGLSAGVEQADSQFSGFGGGAAGYGKRYGAAYADTVTSTFIGGAILPSLLKQDPRYFYKGTGSTKSRILYAIANAVICKGDNKRWEPNYSAIVGGFAAAAISNLYYPSENRNGLGLTFENTVIGIGATAASNILQEFVVRKLTPNLPGNHTNKAANTVSEVLTLVIHQGH
jgi:Carboxypeptidase regulatory-like domain